ncbi:hypothetical protein [Nocardioides psychrotolerans]|uniref:hypothetical protein n=1 Tax=Nocardioides psychrotolerans TaxID=1005945 RepID=UPI000B85B0B5|nr:hypothetical protein [Nocardioides psychrotolerans]
MILTSRAPVSWPTPTQLDVAWADSLADLELRSQDDDGHYRLDAASAPMRLLRGAHLQPGRPTPARASTASSASSPSAPPAPCPS